MTKIKLSEPLEAHGEKLSELTFRPPLGADIAACGYPMLIHRDESTEPKARSIEALIVRLANIPLNCVQKMPARDWNACMAAVLGFFGASEGTSSSGTSTSPGSGE